jgi:tRNA-dependent cyclodipeptide synthase
MKDLSETYQVVAKVKRACNWSEFDNARLQISVGQEYHEGEQLKATLEWASSNFEKVQVCVNDTLQRHNLIFEGMNENEAFEVSETLGREWIERNHNLLKSFPNVEVKRWEQWRNHRDHYKNLRDMIYSYENGKHFKMSVNQEAGSFWERAKRNKGYQDQDFESFTHHTRDYLLEECAVFSTMFRDMEAADIYPGSTLLPCSLLKGMGAYGFTRIDFKHQKLQAA